MSFQTASKENFQIRTNELITVTFDPKTDDLDSIYLKAAGNVIQHVLSENDGNLRRAAKVMGATHSTLSRILTKFKSKSESQNLHKPSGAIQKFAIAA